MAERLSTGLRNHLLGQGSLRYAFKDAVMKLYSGAAPASADDAVTGVLLATISKASGAVSAGEESTPARYKYNVGGHNAGTYLLHVHLDSIDATYTWTAVDHTSADTIAKELAVFWNDIPGMRAIAEGANGNVYVQCQISGVAMTLSDPGGGTGSAVTVTSIEAASAQDTIRFAAPVSGAMAKSSDTWSGVVATSGVAGYFRIVTSDDDGTSSTTQLRLQGSCSTSGAELNMSNTSLVAGDTHTVDSYSISLPAE